MQNVQKKCKTMFKTEEEYESFQDAIYNLHVSKSESEYAERLRAFKKNYKHANTRKAYDYMTKQWIDNEKFNKWQIFHSPPGYANTNSNIESFNRQIKGYPKFSTKLNESALKIDKGLFKKITQNKYAFQNWIINKIEKCCSCRGFLKNAICRHSLAFSHLKNLEWFGPKYTCRSNEFVFRNKTGRKKGRRYKKASSALEIDSD